MRLFILSLFLLSSISILAQKDTMLLSEEQYFRPDGTFDAYRSYKYNSRGIKIEEINFSAVYNTITKETWELDSFDRVLVNLRYENDWVTDSTVHIYDEQGIKSSAQMSFYQDGSSKIISTQYDIYGKPSEIKYETTNVIMSGWEKKSSSLHVYTYDRKGRITSLTCYLLNGERLAYPSSMYSKLKIDYSDSMFIKSTYEYKNDQLVKCNHYITNNIFIASENYEYDVKGNKIKFYMRDSTDRSFQYWQYDTLDNKVRIKYWNDFGQGYQLDVYDLNGKMLESISANTETDLPISKNTFKYSIQGYLVESNSYYYLSERPINVDDKASMSIRGVYFYKSFPHPHK